MEQLNRIELKGRVGLIKIVNVGDTQVARFSLATCYIYLNRKGEAVNEVTWHNVTAWRSDTLSLEGLEKSAFVHIIGRIRNQRYSAPDGSERTFCEVLAQNLKVL